MKEQGSSRRCAVTPLFSAPQLGLDVDKPRRKESLMAGPLANEAERRSVLELQ
jgi:hypothetical protein